MTHSNSIRDVEEDRIQKLIANDPDAPEATDAQLAEARPFAEAFPDLAARMRKNVGGRPRSDTAKQPVSLRLDRDVIAKFKSTGPGWQSRINEVLRAAKPGG